MKADIKELRELANRIDLPLYKKIIELDNYTNKCDCDDSILYNFINVVSLYKRHVLCLNCGGFIIPDIL